MEFSAKQIAQVIQGTIEGDENATVHTFAKIEEGQPGAISFLSNPKYTHYIYDTKSTIVLIDKSVELEKPSPATLIRVDNAYECVAKLLQIYEAAKPRKSGIDPLASISPKATVGKDVYVGAFAVIGDNAVIMMGAIINIGAVIGACTMIDMGAVLGGRATVGAHCHVGAGCVLAGVVEPASATPVVIEDDVLLGANSVVIEGCRVGKGAVVAAGAVVTEDVPAGAVVAGCPARVIKMKDEKTEAKTALVDALRTL